MVVISRADTLIDIDDIVNSGLEKYIIVDVRAPLEYLHDHIPNACNIPLLNDKEREIVGILYKREGPFQAKLKALHLIHNRLPAILEEIINLTKSKNSELLLYCARGGARSEVTQTLLGLLHVRSLRICGGYKAFRKIIFNFFEEAFLPQCITLFGPTGCGKTKILQNLYNQNYNTLDLENCAAHKGSIFGYIGESEFDYVTQKKFETSIWYSLYSQKFPKFIFIEGESKKIGKVVIPKRLFYNMYSGVKIYLEMPLKQRVDFIIDVYKPQKHRKEIINAFKSIEKYIGVEKSTLLLKLLIENRYDEFVELLINYYYDPLYKHSFPKIFDYKITYNSLEEAEDKLKSIYCNFNA
jgi:tRNA 2-selenouridine synthase